jgi:putative ABC transport system permease protein
MPPVLLSTVKHVVNRCLEVFVRSRIDHDIDAELRLHRDLLIEEYERRGYTSQEARRRARLQLGGIDQGREVVRDARGWLTAESCARDIAYAFRTLRKTPGFFFVTVVTLALGIGINVAIFSIVDAVALRPLSYPEANRLVSIWETRKAERLTVAAGNLDDYRNARSFAGIAGLTARSWNLTSRVEPETLQGEEVTWNFFDVIGVTPAIGRPFTAADARLEAPKVAIISDALWRRRFAANPAVVDGTIELEGVVHQVIGVMPASFRSVFDEISTERRTIWLPAVYPADLLANRADHQLRLVGRLAAGVSVAAARAELTGISEALATEYPATNGDVRSAMQPLHDDMIRNVRTSLIVLLLTVALTLAVACVNVANLFVARGVSRRREIAMRFALGASRARVVTALVVESLVVTAIGAMAGLLLATWLLTVLMAAAPPTLPRLDTITMNLRVVAYTVAVSLSTGLLFGLFPAWQVGHSRAADTLAGSDRVTAGTAVLRWRNGLMLAQVALSVVLVVGAGLMVKSHLRLTSVAMGFQTDNVLALRIVLPERPYRSADDRLRFFEELERRLSPLREVAAVGYANTLPLRGGWNSGFWMQADAGKETSMLTADFQAVSPDYFRALGITSRDGRPLSRDDTKSTMPVAVVSRMFERKFLAGESALGRQIQRGPKAPLITIVGVVDDVRRDGQIAELQPQVYLPARQTAIYPVRLADLAIRTHGNPLSLLPAIRSAVWAIDPEQPISNVRTLDELLTAGSANRRFQALLFSTFGLLALVLASVGAYGVVSYLVTQRTPEIGVRLALGANISTIYRWLLRQTLVIVISGAAIGLALARWLARFVSTLLFEVSVGDAPSYAFAAAALVSVAVFASLLAARRAASIDPTKALRSE